MSRVVTDFGRGIKSVENADPTPAQRKGAGSSQQSWLVAPCFLSRKKQIKPPYSHSAMVPSIRWDIPVALRVLSRCDAAPAPTQNGMRCPLFPPRWVKGKGRLGLTSPAI